MKLKDFVKINELAPAAQAAPQQPVPKKGDFLGGVAGDPCRAGGVNGKMDMANGKLICSVATKPVAPPAKQPVAPVAKPTAPVATTQ